MSDIRWKRTLEAATTLITTYQKALGDQVEVILDDPGLLSGMWLKHKDNLDIEIRVLFLAKDESLITNFDFHTKLETITRLKCLSPIDALDDFDRFSTAVPMEGLVTDYPELGRPLRITGWLRNTNCDPRSVQRWRDHLRPDAPAMSSLWKQLQEIFPG